MAAGEETMESDSRIRIVLLGDSGVGKSSVAQRYGKQQFSEAILPTIGLDYVLKRTEDGTLRVQIWDTAGQERFRSIASGYYSSGQVLVVVYDCSAAQHNLEYWLQQCQRYNPDALMVVVANKRDLTTQIHGRAWCEHRQIPFFPVSAKTGVGVREAFDAMIEMATPKSLAGSVLLHKPPPPPQQSCCGWVR
jgi:small GTP-binding protein